MLFNSYEFVFVFLPAAFLLFWYGGRSLRWRLGLLTAASYAFYSWWQFSSWADFRGSFQFDSWQNVRNSLWHWRFTLVMLGSSSVDYWAAKWLVWIPAEKTLRRKALLALSLVVNLSLLGFFKYAGFFSQIASDASRFLGGGPLPIIAVVLPVGISFYTFESMSYVIDIYRGIAKPAESYLDYACFISFFSHLVAGPIIRYSDMLHQFRDANWQRPGPDWDQINTGILFLVAGMSKKLLIADTLAAQIDPLWRALGEHQTLGPALAWGAVLGYTFRIYFDFSGYSDMAVGLGHLFAVRLPQNFNSPYQATDPSDFWRRWHMTLSAWLRDYLYLPLGGNRHGKQVRNLFITMFLGGLWHGAAWLFIFWGLWHGLLLAVFHVLKRSGLLPGNDSRLGYWLNRQLTFLLVVIGWVLFRSADVHTESYGFQSVAPAGRMFAEMLGLYGPPQAAAGLALSARFWLFLAACWAVCNFAPNTYEIVYQARPRRVYAVLAGAAMALCLLQFGTPVDFLYFRF
jgi:alginate O-acetyltransferase complex protein AlgI